MAATEKIRRQVMTAVAALLGAAPAAQAKSNPDTSPANSEPAAPNRWSWDTSMMRYSEDDRIEVLEPQVGVRRDFGDERAWTILATVDAISGATPLGTLPATQATAVNTTTSASGKLISSDVGKIPIREMSDTRLALNTTYERPAGDSSRAIWGASAAHEHDFLSFGGSYTRNIDFNQKNGTLSLGVSPEFDIVRPNGGLPNAFATVDGANEFDGTSDTKYLISGLFGWTQVVSKRTVMVFNYSPTYENGYLTDPYKQLSVTNLAGDPLSAVYEKRPGSRLSHSFYWQTRYAMRKLDVFGLSLRFYGDDWGIRSQTLDFIYRWQMYKRFWFEPHVRYYHQTHADFFSLGLLDTTPHPEFASADYRLASIDGVTFGARMGYLFKNGSELILRAEYYSQTGDDKPGQAVGAQRAFNLFPVLHASILQVDYRFQPSGFFKGKNR